MKPTCFNGRGALDLPERPTQHRRPFQGRRPLLLALLWAHSALAAPPWSGAERRDEARRRIEVGDPVGAEILLNEPATHAPEVADEVLYLRAVALQAQDDPSALDHLRALLEAHPSSARVADATWRLALGLAEAGRHAEALDALHSLRPYTTLSREDRASLLLAVARLRAEASTRPGARAGVVRALRSTPAGLAPSQRALTWSCRIALDVARADHRSPPAASRALLRAEEQLGVLVNLRVPEALTMALLDLSEGWERLDARAASHHALPHALRLTDLARGVVVRTEVPEPLRTRLDAVEARQLTTLDARR